MQSQQHNAADKHRDVLRNSRRKRLRRHQWQHSDMHFAQGSVDPTALHLGQAHRGHTHRDHIVNIDHIQNPVRDQGDDGHDETTHQLDWRRFQRRSDRRPGSLLSALSTGAFPAVQVATQVVQPGTARAVRTCVHFQILGQRDPRKVVRADGHGDEDQAVAGRGDAQPSPPARPEQRPRQPMDALRANDRH